MTHVSASTTLAHLVARSRKLGADRSICNWGGGNTSAKSDEIDFRGRPARVLWVKGSGSDLATVTEASFTGLYLDDVLPLLERKHMSDTEMIDYLAHCFYEPARPRPSIETLLHGFLPFTHVDHTHADATNYFACAANGEKLARDCFGDGLIWIPYRRPGFGLAREVALAVRAKPDAKLVILVKHGLITWFTPNPGRCLSSGNRVRVARGLWKPCARALGRTWRNIVTTWKQTHSRTSIPMQPRRSFVQLILQPIRIHA